jgi:hypothetical protein
LYADVESLVNKKILTVLFMLLVLALPSAFAESFVVTTNKDIYTSDEKAIILGAIPREAPDGFAVLIKITGPEGDCASQHLLPAADNSFISRPIRLDECGSGEFTVSASYGDQSTTSTFMISNSNQADAGSKLELRMLKKVILQAQDAVNARVKELVEQGYVMSEDVAQKYGEGVSEASLALQAIEFGNAAEAKKHMILAVRDFREVLQALSEEDISRFEQTAKQQAANDDASDIVGTYNMLQKYYNRLEELAEKNQVDKKSEFEAAALLLSNARHMIEEGNLEAAAVNLGRVSSLLEEIRTGLFDDEVKGQQQNFSSYANGTSTEDEERKRKLSDIATKYEKKALQLGRTGTDEEAQKKLKEALALITSARANIGAQDLDSARDNLTAAYWLIDEAQGLIEDENDGSSDSGRGKDDDKDNKGSGSDNDDDN